MRTATLLLLTLWSASPATADVPQRIVSTNVCTDQLLMQLVEPARITSVSFLATDPELSLFAAQAQAHTLNRGSAEEVIALQPDLVLAGQYTATMTTAMLRDLGFEVVVLPPASSLADIRSNVLAVAEAAGAHARAAEVLAEMDARLDAVTREVDERALFIDYQVNGWISGQGTLAHDLARLAGYRTGGDVLDFHGMRQVSVEQLLALAPSVMDLGRTWEHPPALATATLRHPALRGLKAFAQVLDIPDTWWSCGLPQSVAVVETLAAAHPAAGDIGENAQTSAPTSSHEAATLPVAARAQSAP